MDLVKLMKVKEDMSKEIGRNDEQAHHVVSKASEGQRNL